MPHLLIYIRGDLKAIIAVRAHVHLALTLWNRVANAAGLYIRCRVPTPQNCAIPSLDCLQIASLRLVTLKSKAGSTRISMVRL